MNHYIGVPVPGYRVREACAWLEEHQYDLHKLMIRERIPPEEAVDRLKESMLYWQGEGIDRTDNIIFNFDASETELAMLFKLTWT